MARQGLCEQTLHRAMALRGGPAHGARSASRHCRARKNFTVCLTVSRGCRFSLLRMTFTKLSFLGGEGVDGGQGNSDYLYGTGDDSERYGISSGMSDSNSANMATGDLQVRLMNPNHVQPVVRPPGIFCTNISACTVPAAKLRNLCLCSRTSNHARTPVPCSHEEISTCLDLQCPDGPAEQCLGSRCGPCRNSGLFPCLYSCFIPLARVIPHACRPDTHHRSNTCPRVVMAIVLGPKFSTADRKRASSFPFSCHAGPLNGPTTFDVQCRMRGFGSQPVVHCQKCFWVAA